MTSRENQEYVLRLIFNMQWQDYKDIRDSDISYI